MNLPCNHPGPKKIVRKILQHLMSSYRLGKSILGWQSLTIILYTDWCFNCILRTELTDEEVSEDINIWVLNINTEWPGTKGH